MDNWKRFEGKTAVPFMPDGTAKLDIRAGGSTLSFTTWYDSREATHVLYYYNESEQAIGLKLLSYPEMSDEEAVSAYKITRNGYKMWSVTVTKFLDMLPFRLADYERAPRSGWKAGTWVLNFEYDDQQKMITIKSELRN